MKDDEPVCFCSSVTAGAIRQAKQNGAVTMDDVRRITGACTLGRCRELSPRGR
jgi:NAD(P)H-nitrite reductase large subunit